MKIFLIYFTFLASFHAMANENNFEALDDLGTISLNLESPFTSTFDIHYPNYRMGGGIGPGRQLHDCLLLDIKHSDIILSFNQKLKLASIIAVLEGNSIEADSGLRPIAKGGNVVFYLSPKARFVTQILVKTMSGKNLQDEVSANLPDLEERVNSFVPVGLVYIRDCRF